MRYSVIYAVDLADVPAEVRSEIERTMEQIAEAVSTIPQANAFWTSMNDSLLQIDSGPFRVIYRIDPRKGEIRVVELEPRRRR